MTKAHATGNDFVMLADPAGERDVDADQVAAMCDRHLGIGGDGLIRAVPAHRSDDASAEEALSTAGLASTDEAPLWFMDYRNADGSVAEMCGNGVRAFAHFLLAEELITLVDGQELTILTRAGLRTIRKVPEGYAIGMGIWSFIDPELAQSNASDALVMAHDLEDPRPALSISMGNPHTVVALAEDMELDGLDLHQVPNVDPAPPHGTNVEFVVPAEPLVQDGVGRLRMRVHERGVGETQSCGTGACAAAAAVRAWAGDAGSDQWIVDVPGGAVGVEFVPGPDGAEHVVLSGPAELVFDGQMP